VASGSGLAFFRAQRLAVVARSALLALLISWPAASRAATLGTVSAVTVSAVVLTGSRAQADAAVLGPQSFQITAANAYTPSTRISIGLDISGASFAPGAAPTIGGLTCQSTTRVMTTLLFEGCAVATNGDIAFQVSNVSYTNAGGLSAFGSSITLSGAIYNASNTTQVFETIAPVRVVVSPALTYTLTTSTAGAGSGTISASPQAPYAHGSTVTLTANAAGGSAFASWGGACSGAAATCTVVMTANLAVSATFIRANTYTLTTKTAGAGAGSLTVSPVASSYLAGTAVTVTAIAVSGSTFAGWAGGCSGAAITCTVILNSNQTVTATFNSIVTYSLAVNTTGSGTGVVGLNPFAASYAPGTAVTLTATPASGSTFAGWSDSCSGAATICTVTMSANRTVGATFNVIISYTLTTGTAGTGTGTIFASPPAASYTAGTMVTLTAVADSGSVFAGWSGGCGGSAATCQVTMNANKAATGTFTRNTTGILRQAGVFSSASPMFQSFLRFYNAGGVAGTVTVTLSDYASGLALGQWTSPSIAPGTAPQYPISIIESALTGSSAKPAFYSVTMQAQFNGTFQHVLWKPGDGTLTNLSTCDSGTSPVLTRVANVHSSALGSLGYPSTIVVYNTSAVAAPVVLHVADAVTGASLGTYAPATIPANGQMVLAIPAFEAALGITPDMLKSGAMSHYIITVQNLFIGYIQHLVNNTQVGVITDMSTVCSFPAVTITVPTNPSSATP
jgi:hypothetical protein